MRWKIAEKVYLLRSEPDYYNEPGGKGVIARFKSMKNALMGETEIRIGQFRRLWEKAEFRSNRAQQELCEKGQVDRKAEGYTFIYVAQDHGIKAIIGLMDTVREGSIQAIERPHDMGIKTVIVTGDAKETAEHYRQKAMGQRSRRGAARRRPKLLKNYKKDGTVAMVGTA